MVLAARQQLLRALPSAVRSARAFTLLPWARESLIRATYINTSPPPAPQCTSAAYGFSTQAPSGGAMPPPAAAAGAQHTTATTGTSPPPSLSSTPSAASIASSSSPAASATAATPTATTPAASTAARLAASAMSNSQALVYQLSATLNQLTGYHSIDAVKQAVVDADQRLQQLKQQLRQQKLQYDDVLSQQSAIHREVTSLLQRKTAWGPADVGRFAELAGQEHAVEQAVLESRSAYNQLMEAVESAQLGLTGLIRERYQQEQLWSDKIRRASTWWTWGLMGLHFTSFVVVYSVLEPRKRAALQAAIQEMLVEQQAVLLGHLQPAAAGAIAGAGGLVKAAAGGREGGVGAERGEGQLVGQAALTDAVPVAGSSRRSSERKTEGDSGALWAEEAPQPAADEGSTQAAELRLHAQQQQPSEQQQLATTGGDPDHLPAAAGDQQQQQQQQQQTEQQQQQHLRQLASSAGRWLQHRRQQLNAAAHSTWQSVSRKLGRGGAVSESPGPGGLGVASVAASGSGGPGQQVQRQLAAGLAGKQVAGSQVSRDTSTADSSSTSLLASCWEALQHQYTLTAGQLAAVSAGSVALGVLASCLVALVASGGSSGAAAGSGSQPPGSC